MYRHLEMYLEDIRQIEGMFEANDLKQSDLDFDTIEDMLIDWEEFIATLRDIGEHKLANEVYERIIEIEERLADYEQEQIKQEEQEIVTKAGNRLSQSSVENLLSQRLKSKYKRPDIGREHQAEFRLKDPTKELSARRKRLEG